VSLFYLKNIFCYFLSARLSNWRSPLSRTLTRAAEKRWEVVKEIVR